MNPKAPRVRRDRWTGNLVPVDFSFEESGYQDDWSGKEVVSWAEEDPIKARYALAKESQRAEGRRKGVVKALMEIISG